MKRGETRPRRSRAGCCCAKPAGLWRPVASDEPAAVSPEKLNQLRDLTPREREIALLVCEGHSNAEVAKRLSKSVLTIKTQLNSVFRKLGVESRAKLMAMLR
jgi:DNA-binding CsgD family transcriptional regulator